MPLSVSSAAINEKNKLGSDSLWYVAMAITIPGTPTSETVRVVRNNEPIYWAANTYQPFPFENDPIPLDNKGTVPSINIRVSNVNRTMEQYILEYDSYIKAYGHTPVTVDLYVLNSKNLSVSSPEIHHNFELKQTKSTAEWTTFVLGAANLYSRRYPSDRILKNHCRHKWKDPYTCKFSGNTPSGPCDKTFVMCGSMMWAAGSYGNTINYGAFPGVGFAGLRIV